MEMAHDAFFEPHVTAASNDAMQAVMSFVVMQQFTSATGGTADCEQTAGTICKLHGTCLQG